MSLISVLTPVYDPDPRVLAETIESVRAQHHQQWQWCLVDDASSRPGVREALDAAAAADPRIQVRHRPANGGIARASQDALEMARGDLLVLLDHDDLLAPGALSAVNHIFTHEPDVDVFYSDEDKIDPAGNRCEEFRKPDWSPDYLAGCMYLGHLVAYRTSLVRTVGGFRDGLDGSQDWDLALRATEQARRVYHLAEVLYHWRMSAASVAMDAGVKPYALAAGRRAVADHLARTRGAGQVEDSAYPGWFHLRPALPDPPPAVTVVIPTAGTVRDDGSGPSRMVDRCIAGLLAETDYPDLQVLAVASSNAPGGLEDELEAAGGGRVRAVRRGGPFNYSASINTGVYASDTPLVLLLNDDIEVVRPDWLRRMVELAGDRQVGVVGAQLRYPDGVVQHAGVTHMRTGLPFHPQAGDQAGIGFNGDLLLNRNYLAVTGACQLIRREVFDQVGGYDPTLPLNYNDVDFCLKVVASGLRVVQVNSAVLVHHESASRPRGVNTLEQREFLNRWSFRTRFDPYARRDREPADL